MTTIKADVHETAAAQTTPAAEQVASVRGRSRVVYWTIRLLLAVVLGVLATYGVLYWQDRPLAEAEAQIRAGNFQRALALSSFYLATSENNARALGIKARAHVELGQAEEALAIFEKTSAANVEELHAWAKAYLINEQWSRALPILTQVINLRPDDPNALHEITTCRIRLGLLNEALPTAQRLSEIPGNEARGLVLQAAIHNDLGDYKATIDCYNKILAYSPDATGLQLPPDEIFCQQGIVFLHAGRPEESIRALQRSLAIKPNPTAGVGLGKAFNQVGNLEAAAQAWKETLRIDPRNGAARESLAGVAMQGRDFEAARKWLEPLQNRPEMPSSTAFLFQRVWTLAGDKAKGEEWARKAATIRKREELSQHIDEVLLRAPYSFWANIIRAHQFAGQGNWKQAEDMIRELTSDSEQEPFIRKLKDAIRNRGQLPSLEELPIQKI